MRRKIIGWLIGKLLPNYHLSRNPPKGIKRPRRLSERVHYLNGGHSEENPYLLTGEELARTEAKAKKGR